MPAPTYKLPPIVAPPATTNAPELAAPTPVVYAVELAYKIPLSPNPPATTKLFLIVVVPVGPAKFNVEAEPNACTVVAVTLANAKVVVPTVMLLAFRKLTSCGAI